MSQKQGTITGRESFMANVAGRLGRRSPMSEPPAHPFRGAPDFYKAVELSEDEKIELFVRNWAALTGKALVVSAEEAPEKVSAWVREICAEHGVRRVSRWNHDGLAALGIDEALALDGVDVTPWRELPEDAPAFVPGEGEDAGPGGPKWAQRSELLRRTERSQLGIVWADYAAANTSSVVLKAAPDHGRSVSLLTSILLAVFRADQLVTRLGEAFGGVTDAAAGEALRYPSSLNVITGPSRSADIENDLTIGIHGPGKVYAVIIR